MPVGAKKGRKVGRNKNAVSHTRYTNEKRWIKNRERRVARNLKKQAKNMEHAKRKREGGLHGLRKSRKTTENAGGTGQVLPPAV